MSEGIIGVLNSLMGSGLSACGYSLQKAEHNRVRADPSLPPAIQQPRFMMGYGLLFLGAISSVANFGLLGQVAQAPFAALTLGYNALLGTKFLGETLTRVDVQSLSLIVLGVALCVSFADLSDQEYTLDEMLDLFTRADPVVYSFAALAGVFALQVATARNPSRVYLALLAYGTTAGVSAGFTGMFVKASVEIWKSALWDDSGDLGRIESYFFFGMLPVSLFSQLYWMNQGIKHFDVLTFIPVYQSGIIIFNLICGNVFFDEFNRLYDETAQAMFVIGCLVTISGVLWLEKKADLRHLGDRLHRHDTFANEEVQGLTSEVL